MTKKTLSSVMHNVNILYNTDFTNVDFGKAVTIHESANHQKVLEMIDKLRDVIKRLSAAEADCAYQDYISPDMVKELGDMYSATELHDILKQLLKDKHDDANDTSDADKSSAAVDDLFGATSDDNHDINH